MFEKYIKKEKDRYVVYRIINGTEYIFKSCLTLAEAIKVREGLENDGWPIPVENKEISNLKGNYTNYDYMVSNEKYLDLSVKVTKAIPKHKTLSLSRTEAEYFFPISPYEDEYDIYIENIHAKAKVNVVTRIMLVRGSNERILNYFKKVYESNPNQYVTIHFLLDKEKESMLPFKNSERNTSDLFMKLEELKAENKRYADKIKEYEDTIEDLNHKLDEIKKIIF